MISSGRRRGLGAALAFGAAGFAPRGWGAGEAPPLVLGVPPILSPTELRQRFTPLAEHLGRRLERPGAVRVGASYAEHERAVGDNEIELAYIGPVAYVHLVGRYGLRPILARVEMHGRAELDGVVFVRQDSPLRSLGEIRGRRFAFGDPESTMSGVLPRYALLQAGVRVSDLARAGNLGTHDNVALGVLSGDFDAGAMRADLFDEYGPERGLRILARLPTVSADLFLARGDLAPAEVEALRGALLRVREAPDGGGILQSLGHDVTGLVPGSDADYDPLRRMLKALEHDAP